MKRFLFSKISHRLYLSYAMIILVLCVAMGGSYIVSRSAIEQRVTESQQSVLHSTAAHVNDVGASLNSLYDFIYNSRDIREYIAGMKTADNPYDETYNRSRLTKLLNEYEVSILDDRQKYIVLLCSEDAQTVYYYSWGQYPPDAGTLADDFAAWPQGERSFTSVGDSYSPRETADYLYFYSNMPTGPSTALANVTIVLGVQKSYLDGVLVAAGSQEGRYTFLDEKGETVPGFDAVPTGKDAEEFIRLETPVTSLGWTLVHLVPTASMLAELNQWSLWVIIAIILLAGLVIVLCAFLTLRINRPIQRLYADMQAVQNREPVYPPEEFAHDELGHLSQRFYTMVDTIEALNKSMLEKERQKREQEMTALQAQINPHFMYNTLNSIKMLARLGRTDQIASALTALSDILKETVGKRESTNTLEQEAHILTSYIYIQQIRYGSFAFSIDLPEEIKDVSILRFLLQPFLENAIFHGFESLTAEASIQVAFRADPAAGLLYITIRDNGVGMDGATLRRVEAGEQRTAKFSGIGVHNVIERIRLAYPKPCGVRFESEVGKGTTVHIVLPIEGRLNTDEG